MGEVFLFQSNTSVLWCHCEVEESKKIIFSPPDQCTNTGVHSGISLSLSWMLLYGLGGFSDVFKQTQPFLTLHSFHTRLLLYLSLQLLCIIDRNSNRHTYKVLFIHLAISILTISQRVPFVIRVTWLVITFRPVYSLRNQELPSFTIVSPCRLLFHFLPCLFLPLSLSLLAVLSCRLYVWKAPTLR